MNVYLLISLFGLLIKLAVSRQTLWSCPESCRDYKIELYVFIYTFILYSFVQILLFGPEFLAAALGLDRILVIRLYYFFDGLSVIVSGYLLMSMFNVSFHKHAVVIICTLLIILVGGYFLVMTNAMVDGLRFVPNGALRLSYGADYVFVGKILVFVCIAAIFVGLMKSYKNARSSVSQIKNFYALIAATFYYIGCFIGLYENYPFVMASRGIVFYVVVLLIVQKSKFFDLRFVAPITIESSVVRSFTRSLHEYSVGNISHKDCMRSVEQSLVKYKLRKISGFKDGSGSSLPEVAESMGTSLSSLYDMLKRLEIEKPGKAKPDN